MSDQTIRLSDLRRRIAEFAAAREWEQFHTPKNLSMSIAIEAAELMEHFQWLSNRDSQAAVEQAERRDEIADELADVVIYILELANVMELDVSSAVLKKLARNEERFPADEWRGQANGVGPDIK